jgi:NADH dehydrogenase FAD-containing subunit
MIEKILKRQKSAFSYGEITAIDTAGQRVQVTDGDTINWINTSLSLSVADTVILAKDETKRKFIVQAAANVRPSVNTLLLV